jgi:hypothetical protein
MRAVDIFAVLQSFVAGRGALREVVVYVSDYGAKEMAREKVHGPKGLPHETVRSRLVCVTNWMRMHGP